jgi:RHS repeat-associated protein
MANLLYGPFGELVNGTGHGDHLRQFNDKEHDSITGLHYYGARYYDPVALHWNNADPLYTVAPDTRLDQPGRLNLYTFSLNNPTRYYDSNGKDGEEAQSSDYGTCEAESLECTADDTSATCTPEENSCPQATGDVNTDLPLQEDAAAANGASGTPDATNANPSAPATPSAPAEAQSFDTSKPLPVGVNAIVTAAAAATVGTTVVSTVIKSTPSLVGQFGARVFGALMAGSDVINEGKDFRPAVQVIQQRTAQIPSSQASAILSFAEGEATAIVDDAPGVFEAVGTALEATAEEVTVIADEVGIPPVL